METILRSGSGGSPWVKTKPRPTSPVVLWQRWERLLFLHWEWSPDELQETLPEGLTLDLFQGRAYLGLIPFAMRDVRPRFLPAVPGISHFLEMNVRTYVRDPLGRPGVWFYSLDCNQPLAVMVARRLFHLPYFHAHMLRSLDANGRENYLCRRQGWAEAAAYCFATAGEAVLSRTGSLEEFLLERYRLYAASGRRLWSGEVWHQPYEFCAAQLFNWEKQAELPLRQAGFRAPDRPPDHQAYAPGVAVAVHPLERVS